MVKRTSSRSVDARLLFEALDRTLQELEEGKLSKRQMEKAEKFYGELIEEINARAEEWVAEPRYTEDVDAGRV